MKKYILYGILIIILSTIFAIVINKYVVNSSDEAQTSETDSTLIDSSKELDSLETKMMDSLEMDSIIKEILKKQNK